MVGFADPDLSRHGIGAENHPVERIPFKLRFDQRIHEALAQAAEPATQAVQLHARRPGQVLRGGDARRGDDGEAC